MIVYHLLLIFMSLGVIAQLRISYCNFGQHGALNYHQLDVFVNSAHMESRLLATTVGVKKLTISYSGTIKNSRSLENLLEGMKQQGDSLPSVINIHVPRSYCNYSTDQ